MGVIFNEREIKAVLFDLDGTLFDHFHSMRLSIRKAIVILPEIVQSRSEGELIEAYSDALDDFYGKYIKSEINYVEKDYLKIKKFFENVGVDKFDDDDIKKFENLYNNSYMSSRRATPGCVETLVRIKEKGCFVFIVTNGPKIEQYEKAKFIGVSELVDGIFTSEELGISKPHREFFDAVCMSIRLDKEEVLLVGDSIENDINGALGAGIKPNLYNPISDDKFEILSEMKIDKVNQINKILNLLGIEERSFSIRAEIRQEEVIINGIGADFVTVKRHCLNIDKNFSRKVMEVVALIIRKISEGNASSAIKFAIDAFNLVAREATIIDESKIEVYVPSIDLNHHESCLYEDGIVSEVFGIEERENSVYFQINTISVPTNKKEGWYPSSESIVKIMKMLQEFLNKISIDYPRAALRILRLAIYEIALQTDLIPGNLIVIAGEGIDTI